MTCNCGGNNEYDITVNNNGDCEPSTPIYNISLGNVGINGYSPTVNFVNVTDESFNLQVENITGVTTSGAIPLYDWVSGELDDINYALEHIDLSSRLTTDGSNADNPIVLNHLTIGYQYGSPYINSDNNLYIRGSVISLQATGDINLSTTGSNKAYYNNKEIATTDQIPTVGNGTITLTQGGVTKGTFTTNQSGNTTIELDEGGGISNPLLIENTNGRQLSLGINNSTNKASMSYQITGGIFISTPVYLIGDKANPITLTEDSLGLYTIGIAYDTNTLGLNANNELTVINSGTSYTAGNGINISNDTISVTNDVLMNTATGTSSLTIVGNPSDEPYTINIGSGSYANYAGSVVIGYNALSNGYDNIAIGNGAKCKYGCDNSIAIGANAYVGDDTIGVSNAIQLGNGTNTISNSLCVGGNYNPLTSEYDNWKLLDLTTGKIPNDRINLDTIPASGSGNAITSGAMYTALGNKQNTLIAGSNISISGDTISATDTTYSNFIGSDSITAGSAGLVPAPSAGDENKFLKGDGTWDTVGGGGGGTSYTAGTGIDITNDTISVNSSVVLTSGNQTISDTKTFQYINLTNSLTIPVNNINRTVLLADTDTLYVGNKFINLYLAGLGTRPQYNNSEYLALYSDIPTVNDATITFTQGGTTKGTITLNQSSNQTIALDASGGGTPSVIDGGNA